MTQINRKTSELITVEEAQEEGLNDFFWNRRKRPPMTVAQQVAEQVRLANAWSVNQEQQEEAKRLASLLTTPLKEPQSEPTSFQHRIAK